MPHLRSFDRRVNALVVGSTGAIGRALTMHLLDESNVGHVISWSRKELTLKHAKLTSRAVDITDEPSIAAAVAGTSALNLIIVATGLLHDGASLQPEKTWRSLNAAALMRSFAVNAIGPALVAKHTLPLFQCDDRAIFAALSARVGSINDNRLGGWYGYRASKAALNQLIRTLSIESARKRKQAIYVGLHPGTVDSELSRPFQGAVVDGQLSPPRSRRTALAEYHRPTEDWRLWTLDRLGWYSRGSLPRFRRAFPSWDNGMSALNSVIEAAEARVARLFESWISSITETCLPGLIQARN